MEFRGELSFLSNFFEAPFRTRTGIKWPTVEHAYQAAKSLDHSDWQKILAEKKPGRVKQMGKAFKLRPDWDDVKINLMQNFVFLKFMQNPRLLEKLIAIKTPIIESNHWHDNFWGCCECENCVKKFKENWLGRILMDVRVKLM